MDEFYKNILHCKVFAFCKREDFPPAKKLVIEISEAAGFENDGVSVL
jgi:hypothetical protein